MPRMPSAAFYPGSSLFVLWFVDQLRHAPAIGLDLGEWLNFPHRRQVALGNVLILAGALRLPGDLVVA